MIPFVDLKEQTAALKDEVLVALGAVMDNTSYCLGPAVDAFETAFAAMTGVKHAVALNTGTSALHLALEACGIGPGDEVITVSMTFVATAAAIRYARAVPVYVDIDRERYTMDPRLVEAAITPKTRAILPVHLYGQPCDMGPIMEIAERHKLLVIEDACQAHLAPVGTFGKAAAYSFYPGKNLGAFGEGGMLVSNDDAVAKRARILRDWGQTQKYNHEFFGYNYRMDGFQGAVLGVKLPHLPAWTARRREIAAVYDRELEGLKLVRPRHFAGHVYHLYAILEERNRVQDELRALGVGTGIHYPIPVHMQKAFHSGKVGDFPETERVAHMTLSLPMYPELRLEQQQQVVEALRKVL